MCYFYWFHDRGSEDLTYRKWRTFSWVQASETCGVKSAMKAVKTTSPCRYILFCFASFFRPLPLRNDPKCMLLIPIPFSFIPFYKIIQVNRSREWNNLCSSVANRMHTHYTKHEIQSFIRFPYTEKRVENTTRMNHCLKCLIYLLDQGKTKVKE